MQNLQACDFKTALDFVLLCKSVGLANSLATVGGKIRLTVNGTDYDFGCVVEATHFVTGYAAATP